jgi:hypothetical protein
MEAEAHHHRETEVIAASAIFRVSRGQLHAMEEAIATTRTELVESGESEQHKAAVAADLRGYLRLCRDIPNVLQNLWQTTLDLVAARLVDDYPKTAQDLRAAFAEGRQVLHGIADLLRSFEQQGSAVPGAETLHCALQDVQQLEERVFAQWPDFSEQQVAEALAEHERGESLEAAEAFARIAGTDRETWLRRVEERKQGCPIGR